MRASGGGGSGGGGDEDVNDDEVALSASEHSHTGTGHGRICVARSLGIVGGGDAMVRACFLLQDGHDQFLLCRGCRSESALRIDLA